VEVGVRSVWRLRFEVCGCRGVEAGFGVCGGRGLECVEIRVWRPGLECLEVGVWRSGFGDRGLQHVEVGV
jgi:hypothetical protein